MLLQVPHSFCFAFADLKAALDLRCRIPVLGLSSSENHISKGLLVKENLGIDSRLGSIFSISHWTYHNASRWLNLASSKVAKSEEPALFLMMFSWRRKLKQFGIFRVLAEPIVMPQHSRKINCFRTFWYPNQAKHLWFNNFTRNYLETRLCSCWRCLRWSCSVHKSHAQSSWKPLKAICSLNSFRMIVVSTDNDSFKKVSIENDRFKMVSNENNNYCFNLTAVTNGFNWKQYTNGSYKTSHLEICSQVIDVNLQGVDGLQECQAHQRASPSLYKSDGERCEGTWEPWIWRMHKTGCKHRNVANSSL